MATVKHALNGKSLATDTAEKTAVSTGKGLAFERFFTDGKKSPFDAVEWEKRTALIGNEKGVTIFRQEDVEVPKSWSQTATNIVTCKYFHGKPGTAQREGSVRQLIGRVVGTIVRWGEECGYFADLASRDAFRDELTHLLVEQKMSFNSPVWFNVGVQPKPQCSACFINSVHDSMESIMGLTRTEGMLFKWGSGTGTNFSTLRGSKETLSGGGIASGPVSFMKGFDAFAGVIKSGGKTRRAAKMVILNIDHPDIVEFIECKMKEERKAHVLIEQGYDSSIDGDAYSSIFFQNANHSVRVTDEFMRAVVDDKDWWTKNVLDGQPNEKLRARDLMMKISDSTWHCGDPGMQYDTTVNRWHTCKNTARINASNPCSEYMFLDDTACNLASLNLMKYVNASGQFDVTAFKHAVDVTITAQEILVDNASYPTPKIAENSHNFRPLGLGYANLGALLMSMALPYDSEGGRDMAGAITALMCGEAYAQSARVAERLGPFPGFAVNREPMLDVIRMHRDSVRPIKPENVQAPLLAGARQAWDDALALGERHGYKNSQVTVLAPTGTIGFMMDCDTTGVEPDLALVKYKKLVGGGMIKIVNQTVPSALFKLGYTAEQADAIVSYIDATGTIEGAPHIADAHLPVFDCSFKPSKGTRSIHYLGHVLMMAATQPFLSGAISKTVNMPHDATVEDIADAYLEAWRQGIKAIAIYRDGSKGSQPLNVSNDQAKSTASVAPASVLAVAPASVPVPLTQDLNAPPRAVRHRLPEERASVTHKFSIAGHDGYITVGLYPNGCPGQLFIKMAKEGSTVSGLMDAFATSISLSLQHGVPLRVLCDKFSHLRFEPSGWTGNEQLGFAKSIMDYIFRWLELRFLSGQQLTLFAGLGPVSEPNSSVTLSDKRDETNNTVILSDKRDDLSAQRKVELALESKDPGLNSATPRLRDSATDAYGVKDRGIIPSIHASDAMRQFVDMGDAPSCHVCGAIMTRNGSCYRCMSCGSTSGCS